MHQDTAAREVEDVSAPSASQKLSVIAPCLNEELNVPTLVSRMMATFDRMPIPCELVLVDDGSTDGTWSVIASAMEREPLRVRGVKHEKNRGIVGGWKSGLEAATGELVCLIDSDLQNRPEDVVALYDAFEAENADVAQGVRHPAGSRRRVLFSRVLNHMLNVSFGMKLRDNKSGFVLCRREVLLDALGDADGYRYFQSFLGVAMAARGYRFAQVETRFEPRVAGESFLSAFPVVVSLKICGELVRYRFTHFRASSK
jgi:phenylacetate-CoA ligase